MQIALVGAERTYARPGLRGTCPNCRGEVIAKCGELIVRHWAHVADECDRWSEGESEWHAGWKTAAPMDRREVVRKPHVADVIAGDKLVCELQHSSIALAEVREREEFYGDMRWIFDARDKEFDWEPMDAGSEVFRWKLHRKHSWPTIGACRRRVMLDFGEGGVLSCETVNTAGSYAWGYLYPRRAIRMWLAGPSYPAGWAVP